LDTGGRYDAAIDNWMPTTAVNAPLARENHTAVWTGSEKIVWGASLPKPLFEHRRDVLRATRWHTNAYTDHDGNSDCDSNSYAIALTQCYANGHSKDSSDSKS
jgi:hypothetical protein